MQPTSSNKPNDSRPQLANLRQQLDKLGGSVQVAAENGLFLRGGEKMVNLKSGLDREIEAAMHAIEHGEVGEAEKHIYKAQDHFSEAWNRGGLIWRLSTEYGLLHNLVTILSVAILFMVATYAIPMFGAAAVEKIVPLSVCSCGILGAFLRTCYWTHYQSSRRVLRRVWLAGCFAGPWIGAILAVATYWGIKAGILVFSSDGKDLAPRDELVWIVSFFAGYKWEWALAKISKVASSAKPSGG